MNAQRAAAVPASAGPAARLRRRLLGIADRETSPAYRGFRVEDPAVAERLQCIGRTFVAGYHAALLFPEPDALLPALERREPEMRGFAYEGAGMGLALLDALTPWKRSRFRRFLEGPGSAHVYMVLIGAGWAWARLPGRVERRLRGLDPVLAPLVLDGYGFHEGYFHARRAVRERAVPGGLSPRGRRGFDQGLGRSLWFVEGADPARIAETVGAFPAPRRGDLWAGAGLAATYAGGAGEDVLRSLIAAAGEHRPALAQGAAFAAKARLRAGNPAPHTGRACLLLCGLDAEEAARITDEEYEIAVSGEGDAAYESWRRGVQDRLAETAGPA